MDLDDLNHDEWVQLLIYGTFALYLATRIPHLFRGRMAAGFAAIVFWAGLFGTTIVAYSYRYELQGVGQRVVAVVFPGTVIETATGEVTVFRRPDGHFTLDGDVGRNRISFVFDTGASTVVLRAEDAARLGLHGRRLVYDVPVSTANGRTLTAAVRLPELRIGTLVETGVEALVAKPGALQQSLLGMSFLNDLESFTVSNDRLVLRGRTGQRI